MFIISDVPERGSPETTITGAVVAVEDGPGVAGSGEAGIERLTFRQGSGRRVGVDGRVRTIARQPLQTR
jgi:hypothetical protein